MGLHIQFSNLLGNKHELSLSYVIAIKYPTARVVFAHSYEYHIYTLRKIGTWMYELWVLFKRVPIIYDSCELLYTQCPSIYSGHTGQYFFILSLLYHCVIFVGFFVFCCVRACVCVFFACIVGKACLFWLTNKYLNLNLNWWFWFTAVDRKKFRTSYLII